jgi:hypothetical protein
MIRRPSAELLWMMRFIDDLCIEAYRDHPSNTMKYIDTIKTYCNISNDKFILTEDGNDVDLK